MGNAIVPLSEEVSLGKLISHALIPVPKKSVNASLVLRTQGGDGTSPPNPIGHAIVLIETMRLDGRMTEGATTPTAKQLTKKAPLRTTWD